MKTLMKKISLFFSGVAKSLDIADIIPPYHNEDFSDFYTEIHDLRVPTVKDDIVNMKSDWRIVGKGIKTTLEKRITNG